MNNEIFDKKIETQDFRRARFYYRYMKEKKYKSVLDKKLDLFQTVKELVSFLNYFNYSQQELETFNAAYAENILPEDEFNWLKNNEKACFWLWRIFKYSNIRELNRKFDYKFPYIPDGSYYIFMGSPGERCYEKAVVHNPLPFFDFAADHQERLRQIIACFDASNDYHGPYSGMSFSKQKSLFLESVKKAWKDIQYDDNLKWLDPENCIQIEWAIDYLAKLSSPLFNHLRYSLNRESLYVDDIFSNPLTDKERYLSVCAVIDSWTPGRAEKALFIQKMRKAWSQKKFRSKNEDNAPLNTYIKHSVKEKLDWLAEHDNKPLKDVLERLIKLEYESKNK